MCLGLLQLLPYFCFLRKSWESGYSCSVGPKIIWEMTSQIWTRLTSDFYSVNSSYIGSNCNFELCDIGDLKNSLKSTNLESESSDFFYYNYFWVFFCVLLTLLIYVSYLFGCAESSFSSCGKLEGLLSICCVQASRCGGFSCFRAQALGV